MISRNHNLNTVSMVSSAGRGRLHATVVPTKEAIPP
jgi:hypothetical protein